jgi:hypothetical protein
MPEISRFLGIVIRMYYRDHPPPHFHAEYGGRMFLHVTHAEYIDGHRVQVTFNDGTQSEIDLSGSLDGPIFEPLRDVDYSRSFSLVGHTLAWPNGADFAPEYLQSLARAATRA